MNGFISRGIAKTMRTQATVESLMEQGYSYVGLRLKDKTAFLERKGEVVGINVIEGDTYDIKEGLKEGTVIRKMPKVQAIEYLQELLKELEG